MISSYEQYLRLPDLVLEDCQMIMLAQAEHAPRDTSMPTQDLLAGEREQ